MKEIAARYDDLMRNHIFLFAFVAMALGCATSETQLEAAGQWAQQHQPAVGAILSLLDGSREVRHIEKNIRPANTYYRYLTEDLPDKQKETFEKIRSMMLELDIEVIRVGRDWATDESPLLRVDFILDRGSWLAKTGISGVSHIVDSPNSKRIIQSQTQRGELIALPFDSLYAFAYKR